MTERTEHPHAWVLRAIADGAPLSDFEVQRIDWDKNRWVQLASWLATAICTPGDWQNRRKQKMHRIGYHTFPAPMTEAPGFGKPYWLARASGVCVQLIWECLEIDTELLIAGLCHATLEAAEAHSKALAAIARGEPA